MQDGIIKWYKEDRQYGFVIVNDELKETYFFHRSDCLYTDLKGGDLVTFDIIKSVIKPGQLCAVNLRKI